MLNRRKFLKHVANLSGFLLLPRSVRASPGLTQYELIAEPISHQFKSKGKPSSLWLYNKSTPGPTLKAKRGDQLVVKLTNRLNHPTTIHWHGIRNLNEMDGVPNVTQEPIEPGASFTYHFPVNDAGTFWYHSHNKAWEQVARGLYGALIVTEDESEISVRDVVLLADDWRLNKDFAIDERSFRSVHDWSHAGRLGNWLTINGQSKPDIHLPNKGQVRFRLINAANARKLSFQFGNKQKFRVISLDGAPCKPFSAETMTLGPAQRADIIVDINKSLNAIYEVSTGEKFLSARFSFVPNMIDDFNIVSINKAKPWYPMPELNMAKIIEIRMQGGAMGNLSSANFQGEERPLRELAMNNSKVWAFNGSIGGYNLELANLSLGDTSILRIWNDTKWEHAMHLHGHHFWVESKEFGNKSKKVLRDTHLMSPGERADFIFIANNPGS